MPNSTPATNPSEQLPDAKRRKIDPSDIPIQEDDDADMFSICNLLHESAEVDINQLCHEIQRMGMMSLRNDVSEI